MSYSPKNCAQCGKRFTPLSGRATRCSNECDKVALNAQQRERYASDPAYRRSIIYSKYRGTDKQRFMLLLRAAKQRSIPVSLTEEEYSKLVNPWKCFYGEDCLKPISGMGLDRTDPSLGYTKENCVPCCGLHNKMKLILSHRQFVEECRKIAHRFPQG